MNEGQTEANDPGYFAVSPLMLFPEAFGRFKVYIRQAGRYVLYASENETFTREHLARLHENGMEEIYVQAADRDSFGSYVERNLAQHLQDERIPVGRRAKVFVTAARTMVQDIYKKRLPGKLVKRSQFAKISAFVEKSLKFLAQAGSLKQIAALMAHDYKVYDHSLQVFVYTTTLLNTYGLSEDQMLQSGVGAMLHDLGKLAIDQDILNKPGPLTPEERAVVQTHPAKGVALCSGINLSLTAMQCILFHHERADGSGYPAGASLEEIPLPAQAVGLVDVYSALTSPRPYAEEMSPFEALKTLRDMPEAFDVELFKRFVMVLSGAEIV